MKCVCNYEYDEEYDKSINEFVSTKGDDPFIEIKGSFAKENTGWHGGLNEVYVYACPKCGTLKIND